MNDLDHATFLPVEPPSTQTCLAGSTRWDAETETFIPILEAGARQGAKADKRDGLGVGEPGDPMFTLQAEHQHGVLAFDWQTGGDVRHNVTSDGSPSLQRSQVPAVAFQQNQRDELRLLGGDGSSNRAIPAEPGMKQQNYIAFALRGREDGAQLELSGGATSSTNGASGGSSKDYIAFDTTQITSDKNYSQPRGGDPCHPLAAGAHPAAIASPMAVRRLTPLECERLQGFPDGWTDIPGASDSARYRAMGNAVAVPPVFWIASRMRREFG